MVYRRILEIAPESAQVGRECRSWLIRVMRFLAGEAGIDQFLDVGCGLPTAENTHQAVQRINPNANVVYVDNDPMVAAHGRALLQENDRTRFVVADLREPEQVLGDPTVSGFLDFDRPIALVQSNTMHHVTDAYNPREVMAKYVDALPSGSYVALSHLYNPEDGSAIAELAKEAESRFMELMGTCQFRSRAQIAALLDGLDVVEPGLTYLFEWWPDGPRVKPPADGDYMLLGAVARKP